MPRTTVAFVIVLQWLIFGAAGRPQRYNIQVRGNELESNVK